jgi:methionyl-tRNA synthetase
MKRFLVTSALPYINGIKHLGNLAGSMLPADAFARFCRANGHETLFICATDEHGTPAELAAHDQGMDVADYCSKMHAVHQDLIDRFAISFDWFGRSHSPQNHELTQHFYHKLDENSLLEERTTPQFYSVGEARFLPDRYVLGICPHCAYDRARGDQCENCTRILDPTDLISPRSARSGSPEIEIRPSRHLFLRQSQLVDALREWIEPQADWSPLVLSIARKWLNDGLKDRSITRDLRWGVPVAYQGKLRPGFEDKVFYVWFDAPIEYISATKEWADNTGTDWMRWWRLDKGASEVRYVQFMGKDNVPFHTVGFPATLLGSQEPWKLVDVIKGFNWLNYYGDKFSTSSHRGVFMNDALELLPADYWRWYLLSNVPETSDVSFTWEHFQAVVNNDLANVFGNFVNRIVAFCTTRFEARIPSGGAYGDLERTTTSTLQDHLEHLEHYLAEAEFRKAASELRSVWTAGNEYLQRAQPWVLLKTDPCAAAVVVRYGLNLACVFASVAAPFIPSTANKIASALGIEAPPKWPASLETALQQLQVGTSISSPGILFHRLEDAQVESCKQRFKGNA